MRIEIACFTARGLALGEKIRAALDVAGDKAALTRCGDGTEPLAEWTERVFAAADALVFIGAAGIAVRAVAPRIVSKLSDPAVVVVDDAGRFAVSLLSGHVGGANTLASRIAAYAGAVPVITTATDGAGVFAVDAWAAGAGLNIANPDRIKTVSARLLAGETAGLRTPFPIIGALPGGIVRVDTGGDVVVDIFHPGDPHPLFLAAPAAVMGIGCRKGTPETTFSRAFHDFCDKTKLHEAAVASVCSIVLKKNEKGLAAFCRSRGIPFRTFTAEELAAVPGEFSASAFVRRTTGVDNVCERSAVLGSGGVLVIQKTVMDGIAFAVARAEYRIDFSPDTELDGDG